MTTSVPFNEDVASAPNTTAMVTEQLDPGFPRNDSRPDLLSRDCTLCDDSIVSLVILGILIVAGLIGNGVVLAVVATSTKFRTIENALNINLAIVDVLLMLIFGVRVATVLVTDSPLLWTLEVLLCASFSIVFTCSLWATMLVALFRVLRFTHERIIKKHEAIIAISWMCFMGLCAVLLKILTKIPDDYKDPCRNFERGFIPIQLSYALFPLLRGAPVVTMVILFGACLWHMKRLVRVDPNNTLPSISYSVAMETVHARFPSRSQRYLAKSSGGQSELADPETTTCDTAASRQERDDDIQSDFTKRRNLVMTNFILISCQMTILVIPFVLWIFFRIPVSDVSRSSLLQIGLTLKCISTPLIYAIRYPSFRRVVMDWIRKCRQDRNN